MTTKEELKELLKGNFEECTEEETAFIPSITFRDIEDNFTYFKPKQKFPIVFEGDNYKFIIYETLKLECEKIDDEEYFYSDKDIEANKKALDKLKELRQLDITPQNKGVK